MDIPVKELITLFSYAMLVSCPLSLIVLLPMGYRFLFYPMTMHGFRGKLIYTDEGFTEPFVFVNGAIRIVAKPDFVYKLVNGTYAVVEYKSRHGSVYESDIHQLLATVLAVRTEFNISRASVTTAKVTEEIHLTSNRKIMRRLKPLIKEKVRIDSGWLPPKLTDKTKCRNCAFKAHCGR